MNVLNNTTNAEFIPTILGQKALGYFAGYMNLAKTVARDFDFTPATEGSVIKIQKRGSLTANSKTAGSSVTPQNPTATSVSVTLDQHYEVTVALDDVTAVLQNQDVLNGYAEDAAMVLAEKIETALTALYTSVPAGQVVTLDETSAATMESSFWTARQTMILNKVPALAPKYAYVHPTAITKLLGVDKFTRWDSTGAQDRIIEGRLARVGGIDVWESQLVNGTGSPALYHNLIYTKNAFVLATRPLPSVGNQFGAKQTVLNDENTGVGLRVTSSYDPNNMAMQITLDVLYGVAALDTRCIVELRSL